MAVDASTGLPIPEQTKIPVTPGVDFCNKLNARCAALNIRVKSPQDEKVMIPFVLDPDKFGPALDAAYGKFKLDVRMGKIDPTKFMYYDKALNIVTIAATRSNPDNVGRDEEFLKQLDTLHGTLFHMVKTRTNNEPFFNSVFEKNV